MHLCTGPCKDTNCPLELFLFYIMSQQQTLINYFFNFTWQILLCITVNCLNSYAQWKQCITVQGNENDACFFHVNNEKCGERKTGQSCLEIKESNFDSQVHLLDWSGWQHPELGWPSQSPYPNHWESMVLYRHSPSDLTRLELF